MDDYSKLWQNARALVLLKVIFDLGRPAQLKELVAATHGDHQTISKYLNILATMGLLTRVYSRTGWALTARGFQFFENPQLKANHPHPGAKKALLIPSTTTDIDNHEVEVINSQKSAFYSENLELFEEMGITLNPQTEFIANHVEPRTVRHEWRKLSERGKPWPGLLIKILSSTPKRKSREETERAKRQRYGQWDTDRLS